MAAGGDAISVCLRCINTCAGRHLADTARGERRRLGKLRTSHLHAAYVTVAGIIPGGEDTVACGVGPQNVTESCQLERLMLLAYL